MSRGQHPPRPARTILPVLAVAVIFTILATLLGTWGYRTIRNQLTLQRLAKEYASLSSLDLADPANPRMREDASTEKARILREIAAASPPELARWARAQARVAEWLDPPYRNFARTYNAVHHQEGTDDPYAIVSTGEGDERIAALTAHRDACAAMQDATVHTLEKLDGFMRDEGCDKQRWQRQFDTIAASVQGAEPYATLGADADARLTYFVFIKQHTDKIKSLNGGYPTFEDPALTDQLLVILDNIGGKKRKQPP